MTFIESEYYRRLDRDERVRNLRFLYETTKKEPARVRGEDLTFELQRARTEEELKIVFLPTYYVEVYLSTNDKTPVEIFTINRGEMEVKVNTQAHSVLGMLLPVVGKARYKSDSHEYESILESLIWKIKKAKTQEAAKHATA